MIRTPRLFIGVLSLVATAVIAAAPVEQGAAPASAKPTIVLVHGAFEDGSAWGRVIAGLQSEHYNVIAAQLPLSSLANDVQATRRVVEAQTGPVVLVGHSWGGAVITDAAAGNPRVKALVYVAAFAPDAHEVVTAYGEKYRSRLNSALRPDSAGFLTVDPAQFQELFASDVPAAEAQVAAATQKPMSAKAFGDAVDQAAWKSIPAYYVLTLDDQAIHPDLQRFYADRMHATTTPMKSSHAVIVSHAAEVSHVIVEAARTGSMRGEQR
jgi:pimeloyl-ACP methyl ester carboxylesterase